MNRNAESHFSQLPRAAISRSTFDRSHSVKTTFNAGDLVPFFVEEVLPGDSFSLTSSKVVRMPALLTPVMDNLYLDTYYFFVPNRLVWEHWREFNGENTQSAWIPQTEYEIPQLTSPDSTGWNIGTIADYFGIPTGVPGLSVNALPFRAYSLICNEWFRDENLTDPLVTPVTDATVSGVNTGNYITDTAKGGLPFKAAKYHDYFTSCLPSPQKGPDVTIPVATFSYEDVPVTTGSVRQIASAFPASLSWLDRNAGAVSGSSKFGSFTVGFPAVTGTGGVVPNYARTINAGGSDPTNSAAVSSDLVPDNLIARTSQLVGSEAAAATINQLRLAFQIQKLYEKDSLGGTRYIEILKTHFGVTSPDARLQRPEYLGGNRIPINVNQIVQQSETTSQSPQGTPVGLSLTTDTHGDFQKSFVEHGFILGLMVVRYDHTYQQGLERMWSRKDRFDYYWPVFANIGEQAVLNKEIYAQGTSKDDEVFGYQEAWADYRYKPNHVTGDMRSSSTRSLDIWHLGDDYESLPSLSDSWIRESGSTVNRILAVTDVNAHQFFADIYIKERAVRPMPLYSVPGLIDHH